MLWNALGGGGDACAPDEQQHLRRAGVVVILRLAGIAHVFLRRQRRQCEIHSVGIGVGVEGVVGGVVGGGFVEWRAALPLGLACRLGLARGLAHRLVLVRVRGFLGASNPRRPRL